MSEYFKEFFASVFTKSPEVFTPIKKVCLGDFSTWSISLQEVLEKLRRQDDRKGWGPDEIPPNVLKYSRSTLAAPITNVFNASLANDIFLEVFKLA